MPGEIHLSSDPPRLPDDAAFVLKIDFVRHAPNPQRVFQAADAMIQAIQRLDRVLCSSIDSHIEPVLMLEEIEAGSIKIWLRNVLQAVDDEALKKLDWRPAVGKYLVRAKYAYIEWTNKDRPGLSLADLSRELRNIASETDVKHLPDYAPPSVVELAETTKDVQRAKSLLIEGDGISFSTPDSEPIPFDLRVAWPAEELADFAIKETVRFADMPMTLIVRKPDYLGTTKWEFRHGKKAISARIEDASWLARFHSRQIDVRPGDALRCLVAIENGYGHDNELIRETYVIATVEGVAENQMRQASFLERED